MRFSSRAWLRMHISTVTTHPKWGLEAVLCSELSLQRVKRVEKWKCFGRKASGDNLKNLFLSMCCTLTTSVPPSPLPPRFDFSWPETSRRSNYIQIDPHSVICSIDYHVHFELISFYKLVQFELKLFFFLFMSDKHSTCYMFNLAFFSSFLEFYFVENFNTTL